MKIETVHEHSYCPELLPANAIIADIGCRNFLWANHFRELGHTVHAVDIDDLEGGDYDQCAITNYTGFCGMVTNNDPQATKIGPGDLIPCYTLVDFMKMKEVKIYDLLKSDIEGSEYDMVMGLKKAPAKQISMEMHIHCGQTIEQTADIYLKLISLGYKTIKHSMTSEHGAGLNYWDSLFILK